MSRRTGREVHRNPAVLCDMATRPTGRTGDLFDHFDVGDETRGDERPAPSPEPRVVPSHRCERCGWYIEQASVQPCPICGRAPPDATSEVT
jgi:rubrerythrin